MYIKKVKGTTRHAVYIRDAFYKRLQANPKKLNVHFGIWSKELDVVRNNDLPANTIGISAHSVNELTLPNVKYHTVIKGRDLHIGPVIGLVGFDQGEVITKQKLDTFKDYFSAYNKMNGLAYLCGVSGIDVKRKRIKGYSYNPKGNTANRRWVPGTFPFAGALYRRAELKPGMFQALSNLLGRKIFNGYYRKGHFNKWEAWKWLSPNKLLRQYLPDTERLYSIKTLDSMLKRYSKVYLKPTMDNMSHGIIKVIKSAESYEFIFPENNKKSSAITIKRMSRAQAITFIQALVRKREYIVQQGIDMKKHNGRGIDFRIILQKDQTLKWSCTAVVARFGKKNGIVTNFGAAGYAMEGNEALRKVFHLNQRERALKHKEIMKVCLAACKVFESKGGNYADVGFDIMIDNKGKVWILELNVRPDHTLALLAKQTQIYKRQIVKPLLYAKALSGFTE